MFERYTEKARRVIFFARYEASQCGAAQIEPAYLLLGLLREDKSVVRRFLATSPEAINAIRDRLTKGATSGFGNQTTASVELPLGAETKRVLAYAHEEADAMGDRHIGTEHLMLGLLRDRTGEVGEALAAHGIGLEEMREEIKGARSEGERRVETPVAPPVSERWADETRTFGHRLIELANRMSRAFPDAPVKIEKMNEKIETMGTVRESAASVGGRPVRITLGVEKLLGERANSLRGERVGLVCNQASVDHGFRHVADLFQAQRAIKLTTLFGPQHGIRGTVQDNMVETPHARDRATGLPVFSLYSETREPTEEMLGEVDVIVFDMQDVGCRIYTFIYTMANCMRAAVKYGKRVMVCDRPNPINGVKVAGNLLERGHESFVGGFPLPTRHGMTTGELAGMFNEEIGCELEIIEMDGWAREQWMDEGDAPWVSPSPNIPTVETATVFPGTVHMEGTQLSEGRGTTRPFELTGAPFIEAEEYARVLNGYGLPGVYFRPCSFLPTFQKHANETCEGVQIHVLDRERFEPVVAGLATIKAARDLYGEKFQWKNPPYEYEHERNPFDVIAGTTRLREQIEGGASLGEIEDSWRAELAEFMSARGRYLLY